MCATAVPPWCRTPAICCTTTSPRKWRGASSASGTAKRAPPGHSPAGSGFQNRSARPLRPVCAPFLQYTGRPIYFRAGLCRYMGHHEESLVYDMFCRGGSRFITDRLRPGTIGVAGDGGVSYWRGGSKHQWQTGQRDWFYGRRSVGQGRPEWHPSGGTNVCAVFRSGTATRTIAIADVAWRRFDGGDL